MADLGRRGRDSEYMDRGDVDGQALTSALGELEVINRFLGGHSSSTRALEQLVTADGLGEPGSDRPVRILDVGCGGADVALAFAEWARPHSVDLHIVAVDFNQQACDYARQKTAAACVGVSAVRADAFSMPFADASFDYVHCSLFLHHFEGPEATRLLRALFALSRRGLIVNDLHRHPIAYWAVKWGSALLSRSYLVRHDGPVSVRRGFSRRELIELARSSGFRWSVLRWRWAFRYVAVAAKAAAERKTAPAHKVAGSDDGPPGHKSASAQVRAHADFDCDVFVVGAGPAGCAVAFALAREGWRVIVAERLRYPADKLCGEFLSADGLSVLERIGLRGLLGLENCPSIDEVAVTATDGSVWEARLPQRGLGCTRRQLDFQLLRECGAAGVQVFEGMRVRSVEGELESGFVATGSGGESVRARLIVAAHGKSGQPKYEVPGISNGRLRPSPRSPRKRLMALKLHIPASEQARELLRGRVELHGFPGGYAGLCEVEGGLINLCLLTEARRFRSAGADCEEFSSQWMARNPMLAERLALLRPQWQARLAVANLEFGTMPRLQGGVLCLGDAAGSITPLCGDGMSMALRGAELLAPIANRFLAGSLSKSELVEDFHTCWRQEFGRRISLGHLLQWTLLGDWRTTAAVRLLAAFPNLGRRVIETTRGRAELTPSTAA